MAIDKIIPRFLVSDEDERLLEEGAMTNAFNVSVSEDGNGTSGVIKNVRGTDHADAVSGSELTNDNDLKVIGQVSDSQKDFIYFFVADNTSASDEDAIYQYNTLTDEYKIVFKSDWFDFDPEGFVKADVVNADFQQDGEIQTILYFTDNNNQPRKINVERALAGDFDGYSNLQLDYALSAIKAPLTENPTAFFETNESVQSNNMIGKTFQFCTQLVYKDGEESAMSPYSSLVFPSFYPNYGTDQGVFEAYRENVCVIDVKFRSSPKTISDVEKIRIIGRIGNNGSFFLVDEVNVDQNKSKSVFGSNTQVYNAENGLYYFYNDGVYPAIDLNTVNKTYDNIPLKAEGQAFVGNRLMYSNYVEGFDNHDPGCTLSVTYDEPVGQSNEFTDGVFEIPGVASQSGNGDVIIDFNNITWDNSTVPANTTISLQMNYNPEGSLYQSPTGVARIRRGLTSDGEVYAFGYGSSAPLPLNTDSITVSFYYQTETEMTVTQLTQNFVAYLKSRDVSFQKTYDIADDFTDFYVLPGQNFGYSTGGGSTEYVTQDGFYGDVGTFTDNANNTIAVAIELDDLNVTTHYKFDDVIDYVNGDTSIRIRPYVSDVTINSVTFTGSIGNTDYTYNLSGSQFQQIDNLEFDDQDAINYDITNTSGDGDYIVDPETYVNVSQAISSFKAGSSHPFGIVYYDKYGRHGFVNEIGSAYVKGMHERTVNGGASNEINKGPARVQVAFQNDMPDWARSWRLVYSGPSDIDSFVITAVGLGEEAADSYSTTSKRIYVSLKPLEIYNEDRSRNRTYSFTEGDKLRVLYTTLANSLSYKNSNSGGPVEFDIVGIVENPEEAGIIAHASSNDDQTELHSGQWLILDAPVINAGGLTDDGDDQNTDPDNLSYEGFDWFQITGTDYPSGNLVSAVNNKWDDGAIVQIVSPKKQAAEKVYYEIGVGGKKSPKIGALTDHGPSVSTRNGSVWWRNITFRGPDESTADHAAISAWEDRVYYIENETPSEATSTKDWHKGKAHAPLETASEKRIRNGIIYGDAYSEDVAVLSLTSFNPSLANFGSVDAKYGALRYIGAYNDDLAGVQENKFCLIPVGKNIIEYASGSANIAVSTDVIQQRRYSSGDYGCGSHPESVLIQDNDVYFVDKSRKSVLRLSGGQLTPISEKNLSSDFDSFFSDTHTKFVSGFDPEDGTYFITGTGGSEELTFGYDIQRGRWQSKYNFLPDIYSNQNNTLYSAKYIYNSEAATNRLFWSHNSDTYNKFYDTQYPSVVEVVSKLSPSRVKVFNALSYEGDSGDWDVIGSSDVSTDLNQTTGGISSWVELEGSYYAEMPRDKSVSNNIYLGEWSEDSGDGTLYSINGVRLSKVPAVINGSVTLIGAFNDEVLATIVSYTDNSVVLESAVVGLAGATYLKMSSDEAGDAMRGHYAKIKLTLPSASSTTKKELYCINTHISDSKYHHALGQE